MKPLTAINANAIIVLEAEAVNGIPKITWLIATLVVLWLVPNVRSMAMKANTARNGASMSEKAKMRTDRIV